MSKTHAIFETPNGDLEILSSEETGITDDQFYNLRSKNTIQYEEGIYTFIFSGTYDQCQTHLTKIASLPSHITPIKSTIYSPRHTLNRTPQLLAPPQALSRTPLHPSRSPLFSSSMKRKMPTIGEDDEEEERRSRFKSSRIEIDEDEYNTLKDTVGELKEQVETLKSDFGKIQDEVMDYKNENIYLRAEIEKLNSPAKPRGNRPTEDELSKLPVIDENGSEVLLSSLNDRQLRTMLQRKQQSIGAPPVHNGHNHQDILNKIRDHMIYELSKKSTMGLAFRIATYFMSKEAFLKTYFKPMVPHSGNNHPFSESKNTICDAAHKLIHYYAKFFAACLFEHSPRNYNRWMVSFSHSLNRKVDYLNGKIRAQKPAVYYTYDEHNPLFTVENCFEAEE